MSSAAGSPLSTAQPVTRDIEHESIAPCRVTTCLQDDRSQPTEAFRRGQPPVRALSCSPRSCPHGTRIRRVPLADKQAGRDGLTVISTDDIMAVNSRTGNVATNWHGARLIAFRAGFFPTIPGWRCCPSPAAFCDGALRQRRCSKKAGKDQAIGRVWADWARRSAPRSSSASPADGGLP